MPVAISPATRIAITTLRAEGLTFEQIAERTKVHYDTVRRTIRRADGQQIKKYANELAKREDILRRMAYILYHAEDARDSIAAAKLIAMMEGWLAPTQESTVNVNVLNGNVDIRQLENEYARLKALESPSVQSNDVIDTLPSPSTSDAIVGQPGANLKALEAGEGTFDRGGAPLGDGDVNDKVST